MNKLIKKLTVVCLAVILAVGMVADVYAAKDYTIYDCDWYDATGVPGQIYAEWDKEDSSTKVKLSIYYSNISESNLLFQDTVGGDKYDASAILAKRGSSGNYYFTVYPIMKGGGGEKYTLTSEALNIDSDLMEDIKKYAKATEKPKVDQPAGWEYTPNGWVYYKGNKKNATNEWITVNGFSYYFGRDSVMRGGWQQINGYWYYLNPFPGGPIPEGAMYANTVTPDGYQVCATGEWIVNGAKVPAGVNVTNTNNIGSVGFSVNTTTIPGDFVQINGISTSSADIVNWTSSPDRSMWSPGTVVTIAANIKAKAGYAFTSSTKFTCSGAISVAATGGTPTDRYVVIRYIPKYTLNTPTGAFVSTDDTLYWANVDNAKVYKITLEYLDDDENKKTQTFNKETAELDLGECDGDVDSIRTVKIVASHGDLHRDRYADSAALTINNFQSYKAANTLSGSLSTSGKRLVYENESGEKMTGWQYIGGYWYHFNDKGKSEAPGWFLDTTGFWYYFDQKGRMMTGRINDGKGVYYLNTGDVPNIPVGAWVQGM